MFLSLSLGVALVRPYAGKKKLKSFSRKEFYPDTNKFQQMGLKKWNLKKYIKDLFFEKIPMWKVKIF